MKPRAWLFFPMLAMLSAALASHGASAAPGDCAAYLQQAMKLNGEVRGTIRKALEEKLDVSGASCKFRSEEWSVREEKHKTWCTGKDAAAIQQRLGKMSTELKSCGADLSAKRQTATAAGARQTPIPAAVATGTAAPREQILHFDQLGVGALPADAFQSVGVGIVQGNGAPGIYASERNMVLPAGRKQVLLVAGERTTSLTIVFNAPIRRFGLARIGTAGGASVPTWTLEAFDSTGNVVGSAGEEHGLPPTPQQFSIAGDGIVRVVLSTDNRFGEGTWATWNSLPIAEFEFTQ